MVLRTNNGEEISLQKIKIPKDGEILGYITKKESVNKYDIPSVKIQGSSFLYKKRNIKNNGHRYGYQTDEENQYLVTNTHKIILLILLILAALLVFLSLVWSSFYFGLEVARRESELTDEAQGTLVFETNVVHTKDEDPTKIDQTNSDLAYITGQSKTYVNKKQPYVYLRNSEVNENYYISYEVYIGEDLVYTTDLIINGYSVKWDAYNCELINSGTNAVSYFIHIYSLDGTEVANTTVSGLNVIKL